MIRQLLATSATFVYIYVWHGCRLYIAAWTVVNFLGIILEIIGRKINVSRNSSIGGNSPSRARVDDVEHRISANISNSRCAAVDALCLCHFALWGSFSAFFILCCENHYFHYKCSFYCVICCTSNGIRISPRDSSDVRKAALFSLRNHWLRSKKPKDVIPPSEKIHGIVKLWVRRI